MYDKPFLIECIVDMRHIYLKYEIRH